MGLYTTVTFEGDMMLKDGKFTTIKGGSTFQTKSLSECGNFLIDNSGKLIATDAGVTWGAELPKTIFYTAIIYDKHTEYNLLFQNDELWHIEKLGNNSNE